MDDHGTAKKLHETVSFVGLRAQATAVGLVQLCGELLKAGVLDDAAVGRIKHAIFREITVSRPNVRNRAEFEATLRRRLDTLFPSGGPPNAGALGSTEALEQDLEGEAGAGDGRAIGG